MGSSWAFLRKIPNADRALKWVGSESRVWCCFFEAAPPLKHAISSLDCDSDKYSLSNNHSYRSSSFTRCRPFHLVINPPPINRTNNRTLTSLALARIPPSSHLWVIGQSHSSPNMAISGKSKALKIDNRLVWEKNPIYLAGSKSGTTTRSVNGAKCATVIKWAKFMWLRIRPRESWCEWALFVPIWCAVMSIGFGDSGFVLGLDLSN